ncbi:MAG: DUF2807 domain-containing protein [Spirochaetaceae bacterium]|nr:DUF2807 domain-containing protein [Spirochaetaceae bacterium]
MRTLAVFFTFLFLLTALAKPCYATEFFERLPQFSRIEISGRIIVQIEGPGDTIVTNTANSMRINVRRGDIRDIDFFMSGETLVLRKNSRGFHTRNITITLNISNTISQLDVSTGALVRAQRNIFDERAEIRAESGSFLELFVDTYALFINCGRDSSIILRGRVDQLEARAVNSGLVNAESLAAARVHVHAFTGSTIRVNATEYLEATAGMRSFVYYKQGPAIKHLSEFAGGTYIEFQ